MAQFPAGSYGNQSSKIRILMYIGLTIVVVAIIAVAVFLRGRTQEGQTQEPVAVNPIGQAQNSPETIATSKPAEPAATNIESTPEIPATGTPEPAAMGEPNKQLLIDKEPFKRHIYESLTLREFFDFRITEEALFTRRYGIG